MAEKKAATALPKVVVEPPTPDKLEEENEDKAESLAGAQLSGDDFTQGFLETTGWSPSSSRLFMPRKSTDTDSIGFTRRGNGGSEGEASTVFSSDVESGSEPQAWNLYELPHRNFLRGSWFREESEEDQASNWAVVQTVSEDKEKGYFGDDDAGDELYA